MKPKFYLNVAAFFLCTFFHAQNVDVSVHFPTGSAVMESESRLQLRRWAEANNCFSEFPVLLRGHTDADAGADYNMQLSRRRNESVRKALEVFGFCDIRFSSYGESWPVCEEKSEPCKKINRRVEVILAERQDEMLCLKMAETSPAIVFINDNVPTTISGSGGSKILVPENAFIHSDGSPARGVRIEYREFLKVEDCLLYGLTTTSNGEVLESGGMMYLRACAGNDEVQLLPGKSIEVIFPSQLKNPDAEMEAFRGEWSGTGVNWVPVQDRSVEILRGWIEPKYSAKYLQKDGTYLRNLVIGGREIAVSYGRDIETIATYSSKTGPPVPLTRSEQQSVLEFINGMGPNATKGLSFNFTGWYNCDRFYRMPQTEVFVNVECPGNVVSDFDRVTYFMVFDKENVVLPGVKGENGSVVFRNVPAGLKATLIAISSGEENGLFCMKDILTNGDEVSMKLQELMNDEIAGRLKRFDIKM